MWVLVHSRFSYQVGYVPRGLGGLQLGQRGHGLGLAGHAPGGLGGENDWAGGRGVGGQQGGAGVQWGLAGFGGAGQESGQGAVVPWRQPPTMSMDMMMEWGLNMMKRMQESDGKIVKKKRRLDGVDDNDEEEELVAVSFNIVGEDDGQTRICWDLRSGMLPAFNGNQEEFWRRQPKVVHPIRESYPESHLRFDPVNPRVTLRDHDRGAKRTIKQYAKVNFRVMKSRAVITQVGLESHDVGLAREYEECTGVYQLVSALWQYAINLFLIRREDYSGLLLLKVLHDIKFFQPVLLSKVVGKKQRDAKQVEVVQHFLDEAMERNSMLGKQAKPPLSYEELLRIARGSANLIYAGTGVGLDWGVDTGTCGLDPYSLSESGAAKENSEGNNNDGGSGKLKRKGGGGQGEREGGSGQSGGGQRSGQGSRQGGSQGGGQGGGQRGGQVGGQSAGSGSSASGRGIKWCRDWNRGECR